MHVDDLAQALEQALACMDTHEGAHAFNLGNGHGFSVREVVDAASSVAGCPVSYKPAPRRAGDPPVLVASSQRARSWGAPRYTSLDDTIETAYCWHRNASY